MSKQIFVMVHNTARQRAMKAVADAPENYIIEVKEPTRSLEQNAFLWPILRAVSKNIDWYGRKLKPEEWKHVFTAALKKEDVVPGLDGGFVVLGQSTSSMSKREFTNLLELIFVFCYDRMQFQVVESLDAGERANLELKKKALVYEDAKIVYERAEAVV